MRLVIDLGYQTFKIYRDTPANLVYTATYFLNERKEFQMEIKDAANKTCLTINIHNKKFFQLSWKVIYDFNLIDLNKTYQLKCIKFIKGHWQLATELDVYDYYEHSGGHAKSIYKNDIQIAKIDKADFRFLKKEMMYIDYNKEENELILIGLAAIFEAQKDNDSSGIDFGNIGRPQAKIYNKHWEAK